MKEGFEIYFYEYRHRYAAIMIERVKMRGFWIIKKTSLFDSIKLDLEMVAEDDGFYYSDYRSVIMITN